MAENLKPLTAVVDYDEQTDAYRITVKNDSDKIVLGPVVVTYKATNPHQWLECINDRLEQMINFIGLNIVSVQTTIPGVELRR